jgi:hypothetical protein
MFRLSIREMLLLVAAIALAIVSLRTALPFWQGIVGLVVMLVAVFQLAAVIFDRGAGQAFAIGFMVVFIGYAALVWHGEKEQSGPPVGATRNVELVISNNAMLPTSVLLQWLFDFVERGVYVYDDNGKEVAHSDEANVIQAVSSVNTSMTLNGRSVTFQYFPPVDNFMRTGHYWWALLLGYIGGRFAQYIYERRTRKQPAPA